MYHKVIFLKIGIFVYSIVRIFVAHMLYKLMEGLTDLDEYILACIHKDKTLLSQVSKDSYVAKLTQQIVKVSNISLLKFISRVRNL